MSDHSDDLDARFARIVASYDAPPVSDTPWPQSEDVDAGPPGVADTALETPEPAAEWDEEEHFVPPTPPPVPTPEPLTLAAWLGVLGGPLGFLLAALAGWAPPRLLTGLLVLGFVGGVVTLIARTSAPGDRDDPDYGAVV